MDKKKLEKANRLDYSIGSLAREIGHVEKQLSETKNEKTEFRFWLEGNHLGLIIGKKDIRDYLDKLKLAKEEYERELEAL